MNILHSPEQAKFVAKATFRIKSKEKVITGCWLTEERMRVDLKYSKHPS